MADVIVLVGLAAIAFAVRLAAASGDLWLDEIWTLNLLKDVGSAPAIFWGISHDNNHFLNSLWMYLVGPEASPLWYRFPAVALGTATAVVAARMGDQDNRAAGLLCGLFFAIGFPFVTYGSEARGYAGLVIATLLAIKALDRVLPVLSDEARRIDFEKGRWGLGAAVGFGTLCHLTMLLGAVILALTVAVEMRTARPAASYGSRWRMLERLFRPAALLVLPTLAALAAGILVKGQLKIGGLSYAPDRFLTGFGGMAGAVLGLPATWPRWLPLLLCACGLLAAWYTALLTGARAKLALIGLAVVPACLAVANPPNTDFPRYFLACGVILTVVMADVAGRALQTRIGAWVVPPLVALVIIGQVSADQRLIAVGRGNVSTLVATMAAKPGSTYGAAFKPALDLPIKYYADRQGIAVARVPLSSACSAKPDWYIADTRPDGDPAPERVSLAVDRCPMTFIKALDLPSASLSGVHLTLFARQR